MLIQYLKSFAKDFSPFGDQILELLVAERTLMTAGASSVRAPAHCPACDSHRTPVAYTVRLRSPFPNVVFADVLKKESLEDAMKE